MRDDPTISFKRDLDDIKDQVKRELDTIRDFCGSLSYRNSQPGWANPFHIHRLRRALRIHYLALKIRENSPQPSGLRELVYDDLDESFTLV